MASKRKRNGSTAAEATQEIRRRAYEIYLERGEQHGRDMDDWLQAERELERGVSSHRRLIS